MMMQMIGSFVEFERATIRERTSAGTAAARAQGRIGGRREKLDTAKRREIARLLQHQPATVSRIVAQHRMGSHKIRAKRKSGRGARDANLEEAALENSPENLDEDQRRRGVARQARDGELPGGDRRTSR
jgi:DNA invertase Pin-like site-specific DNA recombinase